MTAENPIWTDADFDGLTWHDNHVHGLALREGNHGAGELELDIDFIQEWVTGDGGQIHFRIVPATLTFHDVRDLRLTIDYASVTAALCAFSIDGIERSRADRGNYVATLWSIPINWPSGAIAFEASGFTQVARGAPRLKAEQCLSAFERQA
jgi:hypothetical protein